MEQTEDIKKGSLLQINPECKLFGGEILCVTDVQKWGVQGQLFIQYEYQDLTRYKGIAYVRKKWEEVEPVGFIEWLNISPDYVEEK